ncbi:Laminin subunit alpha-1, partial [Zootermopsis nevadensis]
GLFPSVFNLATRAAITVNATCGLMGPEVYCKLVEHVQMRAPQCGVCDANAPDPDKRHPITHAIDGTPRWWQSPSLQKGPQYEWVTVTLDLKQVYQVAYVIVKSAISPRPANWILERSVDGSTYRPWQYYAHSDDECWARYGIEPTRGKPSYKTDSDIICTSYYSKLNPLEGGEIHTSLVVGRPGANESSTELLEFTLARYVRLRLQKIRTLNAEFMSLSPGLDDASVTRRLFYSIKDISIGGQCVCSGHASKCVQNGKFGRPECECQHNTCGANCDHCCPLYNQLPWRAGTPSDGAQCEPCQCFGHATSCRYDAAVAAARLSQDLYGEYRGGGVCINCTAHTTGKNCERCEDGWYRPVGVSPLDPEPCRPCNCDNKPGTTGRSGTCECHVGFGGLQCDRCAPGFRDYPNCTPCSCDVRGINATIDCETSCTCKENVEGERCDRCKSGYFALNINNPGGCMQCYCSGVSSICHSSTDLRLETFSTLSGWLVSDLAVSRTVLPSLDTETKQLSVGNYELPGVESYFWLAPENYHGNLLASYGSNVSFSVSWVVMRGDTSGRPTVGPNIVLIGSNGLRLGAGNHAYKSPNATLTIPLHEDAWYHIPNYVRDITGHDYNGEPASRDDLMSILTHVKHLLLRAKFHTDQVEGSLIDAEVQTAIAGGTGSAAHLVEHCDCPPGYTGLSCEECGYGYVRVWSSLGEGECRLCDCNGHAATCDPVTGKCAVCEHNTNGTKCDYCIAGYYGDATQGTPSDCQQCACPLVEASNNFSPNCELKLPDRGTTDHICTDCPQGYDGDHCERCSSGFYGSPAEPGSTCKRCDCGGGPCDERTGQCLRCRGNTQGWRCEQCIPNHYGNPSQADCKPCACNELGSEQNGGCDSKTGQCKCRERYTGRACDSCQPGFGNVTAGCVVCSCDSVGSLSEECDPISGKCNCQTGVGGPRCNRCEKLHFGFSSSGCQSLFRLRLARSLDDAIPSSERLMLLLSGTCSYDPTTCISCGCHVAGSEGPACDIVTGQCPCRTHVTGRTCDNCQDGFWGLNTSRGCVPCECDSVGSASSLCDVRTGQCHCRSGVGGLKCDQCHPGFFGFSAAGCSECERCDIVGHVCDPDTGRCMCPPLTTGPTCDHCQSGAWGYEPGKGCKPCGCDTSGSVRVQCDVHTGRCTCREGFLGDRCTSCSPGYHGFPRCQRCDCHLAGTVEAQCDVTKDYCVCDNSGQCPCKANVSGKKCNHCKPGTFGLQADNPDGCTQCFCFGRTTACTQAGLTVSQIMMAPAVRTLAVEYDSNTPQFQSSASVYPVNIQQICYVNVSEVSLAGPNEHLNITNNLQVIPGDIGDVQLGVTYPFDTPVYWQLPKQFLGDRVLSYGGYLRFRVETEGGHTLLPVSILATYPLVQLQGNGQLVLEHYPLIPSSAGHYQVRLHESLWRQKSPTVPGSGDKVTREMLMVALQNVQHILIRASDSVDFTRAVLRDVSLDTGILAPGRPPPLARGVELCDCPPQYNSSSCQDPSIGFYRWYDNNSISSTIVIQLVGEARPCQCNQRSRVCNIETGYCLNCAGNTGGPHCERCGEGYYGDPARGPCKPCPCPTTERNFARSCRVSSKGHVNCQCKEGYTGKRCDRCSYGWFGFPQLEGGSCKPCNCNHHGSVSDECHEETGQCNCRPGIIGRDCSECSTDRFILTQHGCTTCDDGCTGVLLDELALLDKQLQEGAGHLFGGIIPPPWPQLQAMNNTAIELKNWLDIAERVALIPDDISDKLKWQAQQMLKFLIQSRRLEGRGKQVEQDGWSIQEKADTLSREISALREEIDDVVMRLTNYGQAGPAGIVSVGQALREAIHLLHKIKERNLHLRNKAANHSLNFDVFFCMFGRLCTDLLNRIQNLLHGLVKYEGLQKRLSILDDQLSDLNDVISKSVNKQNKVHYFQQNFEAMAKNLTDLISELEKREGILDHLNPIYREKYVLRAQMHANKLYNRVQHYRDLFNATQRDADFALRASKAYQEIVDALKGARNAAVNASSAADIAYRKAHPSVVQDSLVDRASIILTNSTRLLSHAEQKADHVEELKMNLEEHKEEVKNVRDTLAKAAKADNNISHQLQKLDNKEAQLAIQNVLQKAEKISDSMDEVQVKADMISSNVKNELRPRLEQLSSDFQVNAVINHITSSQENIQKSEALLSRLSEDAVERNRKFQQWNDTMAARLQELRNKITQARHAANGIHLSITSRVNVSEGCVRSFRPSNLEPSTTTLLVIDYALDSGANQKDALILYLPSSTTEDFIAVEMVAQHVRFLWDVGGGAGEVQHPLKLEPGKSAEERNWYNIQIDRKSNIAKLSVKPHVLPEGSSLESGTPVKNSSTAGFGRLDVGPGDVLWIGGLPPVSTPGPPLLKTKSMGLAGCLQRVVLDGHVIGLWNFASQGFAGCAACIQSGEQTKDELTFRFNGEGYAVLHRPSSGPYNKYAFSVSLKFRTLDENALLFLAVNPNVTDRYVSLTLRNGKVLFRVGYGGETRLEMASQDRHNTGNWTIVEASRLFDRRKKLEKGILKVEGEARDGAPTSPPGQEALPDLSDALYFVGGVPPGSLGTGSNKLDLPGSFLGCLAEIQVVQDGYSPLRGQFYGVEAGCADSTLDTASFHGRGHLQLPSHSLDRRNASFGFVFRTLQPNALLMVTAFRDGEPGQSFYSVSLVDGTLNVQLNAGRGGVTLSPKKHFNDGKFHSLSVTKTGRRLELRIDDELQDTVTLPKGATVVRAPGPSGGLYFGGVPSNFTSTALKASPVPLIGTIKDVIFNDQLLQLDHPISFEHVGIGRLDAISIVESYPLGSPSPSVLLSPRRGEGGNGPVEECHKGPSYSLEPGAAKFGDSPHSHVQIRQRKSVLQAGDFTVELDFRTLYPNGLLFLLPGGKGKKLHYILLQLRNKRLHLLIVKGEPKLDIQDTQDLNDGLWHRVVLNREGNRIMMIVDSNKPKRRKRYPKKLNFGNTMYVGGVPENGILLPDLLLQKLEGFKGCLRGLAINQQSQNLSGHKVGQCFPLVEKGSYFPGDAYAVYEEKFHVGSQLELQLEFRTSENTGVLLSVSEPNGYPALSLEINDGKVIMTGDMGNQRPFHVEQGFPSRFTVCDNRWHHVKAFFENDVLNLRVDNFATAYGHSGNGIFTEASTNSPLYIGGLPEGAPSGTLGTRDNFKGCIRNVVIGKKPKDWTDMASLNNILLSSCPVSS